MQVMCKQCLTVADVPSGVDPHRVTFCKCCDQDHSDHAAGARECSPEAHNGEPCWNPPTQPVKPEGCGVCRPVVHFPTPGPMQFTAVS